MNLNKSIQKSKSIINSDGEKNIEKKAANAANLASASPATSEIPYLFGNPSVDIVKGFIHIYKDWWDIFSFFKLIF